MFSTFNFYLARRFLFWVAVLVLAIGALISLFEFIELLRRAMSKPNIGLSTLIELTFLKVPGHIQNFFPFICLLTAQITFWRLNQDQEIIAIRSLGVSVFQLLQPILLSIMMLGTIMMIIINPLASVMERRCIAIENMYFKNKADGDLLFVSSGELWLRENVGDHARIFKIEKFNIEQKEFRSIQVFEMDETGLLVNRYIAERGIIEDKNWILKDIKMVKDRSIDFSACEECHLTTNLSLQKIQESNAPPETISFFSLPGFIKNMHLSGLSTIRYELHWYNVISKIPLAMALILLAAAFCLHPVRYKKVGTLVLFGVITGFTLHFLADIIHALGLAQKIPVLMAAFMPTFITLFLSLGLILHVEQG
ncbi:MAG: Lipopolysaccharide export system permease protein LptG [Holosporales bacterium]